MTLPGLIFTSEKTSSIPVHRAYRALLGITLPFDEDLSILLLRASMISVGYREGAYLRPAWTMILPHKEGYQLQA